MELAAESSIAQKSIKPISVEVVKQAGGWGGAMAGARIGTTLSVSASKAAIPGIDEDWKIYQKGNGLSMLEKSIVSVKGWPNNIFMPADLQEMLTNLKKQKPDQIKIYKINEQ